MDIYSYREQIIFYGLDRFLRVLLRFVLLVYGRRLVLHVLIGSFTDMEYSLFFGLFGALR